MSSSSASRDFDPWDDFERALSEGIGAGPYWLHMGRSYKSDNFFIDMLLMQFEDAGANLSLLASLVDDLESPFRNVELLEELVRGAFDIAVRHHTKPSIDQVEDLPTYLWRYLSRPTDPFHLGQFVDGRYFVQRRIGHGAFGVVYKCLDKETREHVACKALHRTRLGISSQRRMQQLELEWYAMQRLSGPSIPKSFSLNSQAEFPYITMEYIDGSSLRELIKRGPIAAKRAAQILLEVAEVVEYAHDHHQVIHRDLKPENVLIDKNGNVFVVDFGLIGSFSKFESGKRKSVVAGTNGYMAPELLSPSHLTIDGRADIYAIGVMLYEMLTGELPLTISGRFDTNSAVWPEAASSDLMQVGRRCIEPDPSDRYEDAYDLIRELQRLASMM